MSSDSTGEHIGSEDVPAAVTAHLCAAIGGPPPESASVTLLGVEAVRILRFGPDRDDTVRYATVGCSRHPMTDPSAIVADPVRGPRAELVLAIRGSAPGVHVCLAILAAAPAVEGVVFTDGALIDLGEPLWTGAPFTAVLLADDSGVDELALTPPADPVHFFAVTPITGTEAAMVRLRGADALREAWAEAGIDPLDPDRGGATLTP